MVRGRSAFKSITALTTAVVTLVTTAAAPVFAADQNTGAGNGMRISPVHTELTLRPGQSSSVDVFITNVTGERTTYQSVINDFVATDETGNPAIILDPNQSAPSHGLKQFITPINNITLNPGEQKSVKAVINLPANVAPGGYYGAVRFAPLSASTNKNISLSASVASLVLVRVTGALKEQVTIASFNATSGGSAKSVFTSKKDISATVRFKNSGNVQEQPFGKVVLKKGSKTISTVEVNSGDPRGNVLPDSIRKFSVPLSGLSSFGRYTIEGNFGYSTGGKLISAKSSFYIIPVPLIVIALIVLVLLIAAIIEIPRMIKRYNKRVLRKAGR